MAVGGDRVLNVERTKHQTKRAEHVERKRKTQRRKQAATQEPGQPRKLISYSNQREDVQSVETGQEQLLKKDNNSNNNSNRDKTKTELSVFCHSTPSAITPSPQSFHSDFSSTTTRARAKEGKNHKDCGHTHVHAHGHAHLFSTVMTTSPASTLMPMGADSDPEGVSRSPSDCLDSSADITAYASPPEDVRLEARTMSWHT